VEVATDEFTNETWFIGDKQIRDSGITGTLIDAEEELFIEEEINVKDRVSNAKKTIYEKAEKDQTFNSVMRQKIAAILKNTPAKAVVNKIPEGGLKMDLKEFIEQPGAEEKLLAYAKEKTGTEADEAIKAESARITELLALSGVRLTDDIKQAIDSGKTPETYAVDALKKQREVEARLSEQMNDIKPGKVPQTLAEQTASEKSTKEENLASLDSVKEFAAQLRGGR
jgi:hypothetical protein